MDFAEILLRRGLLTQVQVNQTKDAHESVMDWVLSNPSVDTQAALEAIADEMGVDFVDLRNTNVELELLETFPQKLIFRESLFPISRENGSLRIATADPLNFYPLDEAAAATGLHVEPVLADRVEIQKPVSYTHLTLPTKA